MATLAQIVDFAPPEISLPAISLSAPESRIASAPQTPRRQRAAGFSQPVSPVTKKPVSPITKTKQLLAKKRGAILDAPRSPMRLLRKHVYATTFATHNPRDKTLDAKCPVHSYSTIDQEIAALPSKKGSMTFAAYNPRASDKQEAACPVHSYSTVDQQIAAMPASQPFHGTKFGDAPRSALAPVRPNCPVHVYAEAKSTLSRMGSTAFAKHDERDVTADACPVHAYATPPSTLEQTYATFAKHEAPRTALNGSGPAVHAYETPRSMLASARGTTAFSTDKRFQDSDTGSLAPVHAYETPRSMLRSTGAVAFGSTAPRGALFGSLSRTGLMPGTATPRATPPLKPRTLKPLPKIEALVEAPPLAEAQPALVGAPAA